MSSEIETDVELLPLSEALGDWAHERGDIFAQPRLNKVPSAAWLEQLKTKIQAGLEPILAKVAPRFRRTRHEHPFEPLGSIEYVKEGNRIRYVTFQAEAEQIHDAVKRLVTAVNRAARERNEAAARAIEETQRALAEQDAMLRDLAKRMEGK
jgi:hypothetical protein